MLRKPKVLMSDKCSIKTNHRRPLTIRRKYSLQEPPSVVGGDRFIPTRRNMRNTFVIGDGIDTCKRNGLEANNDHKSKTAVLRGPNGRIKQQYRRFMASTLYELPITTVDHDGLTKRMLNFGSTYHRIVARPHDLISSSLDYLRVLEDVQLIGDTSRSGHYKYRHIDSAPFRSLEAPGILNDFYTNTICWSKDNILAVALGTGLYFWHPSCESGQEFLRMNDERNPITSVSFCEDVPELLAVGTANGEVVVYNIFTGQCFYSVSEHLGMQVGTIAWNKTTLTTGDKSGQLVQHDLRFDRNIVADYTGGHLQEICALKWNPDGRYLASGSNCNTVCIWDNAMPRNNRNSVNPLTFFSGHQSAVKAIDWCPGRRGLIATGGGYADQTVKVWDCNSGHVKSSVNTGAQVSGLHWSRTNLFELLSSHGYPSNHMSLWKLGNDPDLEHVKKVPGFGGRILSMTVSHEEETVATAGSDEQLRLWHIFRSCTKSPSIGLFSTPTFGVPQIR
ncbi:WD40 repeat-containing protein [Nitzschia inconspicua]|uniref:WD40 repeat-containing protein n=1 Tax=Nitzschia inconspicua TaxID=303405 RepID=A0A9K3Q0Z3_9STRA|nr:WD40 repeat-containing protein [Nitzschia inconspicua]